MSPPPLARLALLVLLAGAAPSAAPRALAAQRAAPSVRAADTSAVVRWNVVARHLWVEADSLRRPARAQAASGDSAALRRFARLVAPQRVMMLLSLAQYAAATEAPPTARAAAIADASAEVLSALLPDSAGRAAVERERARQRTRERGSARLAAAGRESLGRRAAARILAWGEGDRHDAEWTGTVPTGPGMWYSRPGAVPGNAAWTLWRPWALDSASQFRPAPPPAYGSPAFDSAVAEVRLVARTRSAEQSRIARWWAAHSPYEIWNGAAVDAVVRARMTDAESARTLALMNVAIYDAALACWDAKYHYWLLRPSQADSTITFPDSVPLPNFPSYPSGHAAAAGAAATVLGTLVPSARAEAERLAAEGAVSRLYAGVHYRFDNDVGLELGRRVARYVLAQDARGAFGRAAAWRLGASVRRDSTPRP